MSRLNNPEFLVGKWDLNGNAKDTSGYGNDGTFTTEAYAENQFGHLAGVFNGTNSFVNIADTDILDYTDASPKTISFWFKLDDLTGTQSIMGKWGDTNTREWLLYTTTSTLNLGVNAESTEVTTTVEANRWYHATIVLDTSGNSELFIDGVSQGTGTASSFRSDPSEPIRMGQNNSTNFFAGTSSELRIYNIILTQDEVLKLFHTTKPTQTVPEQPLNNLPDLADSSLKGAWLNKAVKGTGNDYSTNQDDGTVGDKDIIFQKVGAIFDGVDDDLQTIGATTQVFSAYPFTMSAWVKLDTTTGSIMFISDASVSTIQYGMFVNSGTLTLRARNTTPDDISGSTLSTGQWYHIAGVWTSATSRELFLNGVSDGTDTSSVTYSANVDEWSIGSLQGSAPNTYLDGDIKDVRMYSEAKTADFIKAEYEAGVPDDNLILHILDGTKDLSKYKNTLTNQGNPNPAFVGKEMGFDGTGTNINTTIPTGNILTTAGTLSCWFKPTAQMNNSDWVFGAGPVTGGNSFTFTINGKGVNTVGANVNFGGGGASTDTDATIIIGKWHHAVASFNGSTLRLFIDGAEVGSPSAAVGTLFSTQSYSVSEFHATRNFEGSIKDCKVHNIDKSAAWAKQEYNRTKRFY